MHPLSLCIVLVNDSEVLSILLGDHHCSQCLLAYSRPPILVHSPHPPLNDSRTQSGASSGDDGHRLFIPVSDRHDGGSPPAGCELHAIATMSLYGAIDCSLPLG